MKKIIDFVNSPVGWFVLGPMLVGLIPGSATYLLVLGVLCAVLTAVIVMTAGPQNGTSGLLGVFIIGTMATGGLLGASLFSWIIH